MLVLLIVALAPSSFADNFYPLTNSSEIPEIYARKETVTYNGGIARINLNVRRQNHTIAVGRGQPLKFTVGLRRLCTHVDMITFYIEDYSEPKKSSLNANKHGLHFLWRQLGNSFEVHQRNRDASSEVISLEWLVGSPREETKADVTVGERGNVMVQRLDANFSATICIPGTLNPCSFTRYNDTGEDVFELEFVTTNDMKCGLFVELEAPNGRLVFPRPEEPKWAATTAITFSSIVSSRLVSNSSTVGPPTTVPHSGTADLDLTSTRSAGVSTLAPSAASGRNRKITDNPIKGDRRPTRNAGSQDKCCSLLMVVACVCLSTGLPFLVPQLTSSSHPCKVYGTRRISTSGLCQDGSKKRRNINDSSCL